MATQLGAVSGLRKRPLSYVDQINVQRQYLPQLIQAKAERAALTAQQALQEKQYGLSERELGINERNLGIEQQRNKLMSQQIEEQARGNQANAVYNQSNIDLANRRLSYEKNASAKTAGLEALKFGLNLSASPTFRPNQNAPTPVANKPSTWGSIAAPAVTGAVSGFGAAKLFGGNKVKKSLFGIGAGLLSGVLGGNWGNWGAMAGSGFGGLIGGLFG